MMRTSTTPGFSKFISFFILPTTFLGAISTRTGGMETTGQWDGEEKRKGTGEMTMMWV
jgi:hypothetical protein